MTGVVFDIKKFAVHDGPGIRSTVFFKGCPLRCRWCHNPESISFQREMQYMEGKCIDCGACVQVCPGGAHTITDGVHQYDRSKCTACGACEKVCMGQALVLCGRTMTVEEVLVKVLQDKAFYDQSGGGVTLSGGECLCQADFCADLLKALKQHGIHCAVDTSGFVSREAICKVEPYTDLFLYDIKHMDEMGHMHCTGRSNRQILDNLRYLNSRGKKIEIRIPVIPGLNDTSVGQTAAFLQEIGYAGKVKLLAYNNLAGSKYTAIGRENIMPDVLPPEEEELQEMVGLFRECGIAAEY